MKEEIINSILILFIAVSIIPAQIASGGSYGLEKSAIAGGGGESTGGAFAVTGTSGQNAAGTASQSSGFSQMGGFWTPDQVVPTSAVVSVGGMVSTLYGNGIRNVWVTLTDSQGNTRRVVTGSFGYFRFTDVEVGDTYVMQVHSKRYSFSNPTQIVAVNDELTGINFTAAE